MSGGPFQNSPEHGDAGENLQQAVIHVDSKAGDFHPTALFWYLAHFSRFVRPGTVRVSVVVEGDIPDPQAPEGTTGIEAVAFLGKSGQVSLQLLNNGDEEQTISVVFSGFRARFLLPGLSITSAQWHTSP